MILALLLAALFSALFWPNFQPGMAHFANDGPIGTVLAVPYQVPDSYRGIWNDLLFLGAWNGNFNPNLYGLSFGALGPALCHKFMIPIGLIFLALSAVVFFQRLGLPRWVCVLAGLAAALNMNVFSNACWGLPTRAHAMGAAFLALAAFHSSFKRFAIVKAVLAGLAIGLGISEGGDNGAIFAIVVGCYGLCRALSGEGSWTARLGQGAWRVGLAAVVAAVFAAQTLNIFVNTSVKGVVGLTEEHLTPDQKREVEQRQWDFATMGSLPRMETLRVIIPGLYGYRMEAHRSPAEEGGNYWGRVGESLAAVGSSRHSGAGEYAGLIVVLVALWALHQSFRARGGAYTPAERKFLWFWGGTAACCLLLAWGKWGPGFGEWVPYGLQYKLPYFNTIRLPLKWMHPFHMCLVVLFAYGLTGLGRLYLSGAKTSGPKRDTLQAWWSRATGEERRWTWFSAGVLVVALLGAWLYTAGREDLIGYLAQAHVDGDLSKVAAFSIREVWLFVLFLLPSLALVLAIISGRLGFKRVSVAAAGIGLLLVVDLVRANSHWMEIFNYRERYAMNPPLEYLQKFSQDFRVAKVPNQSYMLFIQAVARSYPNQPELIPQLERAANRILYYTHEQWQQNHFQYYDIRCLDMSQEPRPPADKAAFHGALNAAATAGFPSRQYEITSTRHFVGLAGQAQALNAYYDPAARRFREGLRFDLVDTKPNCLPCDQRVRADSNGPFAIIEFTGAIPRAKLFAQWEVMTNESQALARLAAPDFDPARTVLVQETIPASTAPPAAQAGEASIIPCHTSHRVTVDVKAAVPSVLLLTDRFDADWRVVVDGQPATLLRCNYLMRGVQVLAGPHKVEFTYHPKMRGFWLMAGCDGVGLCLLLFLAIAEPQKGATSSIGPAASLSPQEPPAGKRKQG